MMRENIEKKLNMTIDEYIELINKYMSKVTTEDDNPISELSTEKLTDDEVYYLADYIYEKTAKKQV